MATMLETEVLLMEYRNQDKNWSYVDHFKSSEEAMQYAKERENGYEIAWGRYNPVTIFAQITPVRQYWIIVVWNHAATEVS